MHRVILSVGIAIAFSLATVVACYGQNAVLPQDEVVKMQKYQGPQDTPEMRSRLEAERFLAPHIEAARRVLPDVKRRFLGGLPRGSTLFVTVAIQDGLNKENAYVAVSRWDSDRIDGIMATELRAIHKYKMGQKLIVYEKDVIDWTITSETGEEEGNFIGKFMDAQNR
jgi:uncharacterized protein YegJ (DUF2314 family)